MNKQGLCHRRCWGWRSALCPCAGADAPFNNPYRTILGEAPALSEQGTVVDFW